MQRPQHGLLVLLAQTELLDQHVTNLLVNGGQTQNALLWLQLFKPNTRHLDSDHDRGQILFTYHSFISSFL